MVRHFIILLTTILLTACETFDFAGLVAASSSAEQRFEDARTPDMEKFYPSEIDVGTADYSFAVATDLHAEDNKFTELANFFDFARADGNLFAVLLGDYPHKAGKSLRPMHDILKANPDIPCFTAIGNHDVYKGGYDDSYAALFGPTSYFFSVRTASAEDLFIVLDSANGTLGRGQFNWLATLLSEKRGTYRHCFVFTHANFFLPNGRNDSVSTYPTEEFMKLLDLFARNNVTAVFTGHSHTHDETMLKGVSYITLNPLLNGPETEYAVINCFGDGKAAWNFNRFN